MKVVRALEGLTQREELQCLTLLTWREVFPLVGLVRPTKAWCGACYEEQQRAGHPIYDPLLWAFQDLIVCVRHQQYLRFHCPYQDCQKSLPWLAWSPAQSDAKETELLWQRWVTESLGKLLACASTVRRPPTREMVTELLAHAVQVATLGNCHAFARLIEGNASTVSAWLRVQRLPQLKQLLRACYVSGLSLCAWLLNDERPNPSPPKETLPLEAWRKAHPPRLSVCKGRGSIYDTPEVRLALEKALESDECPPPSMKEVARRLGYQYASLVMHYSEICRAISARYVAHLHTQRKTREQREREELRRVILQLHAEGEMLTFGCVARALDKPGWLRAPYLREAFYELRRELETEDMKQIAANQRLAAIRQSL